MNDTGKAYIHGQWRYFVDEREDNGKFTVFMSSTDSTTDGLKAEVATIPDFPTFEEAQNALDGYALKHQFAAECSTPNEGPEMEQQTFGDTPADNDDSVPSADDTPEVEEETDEQKSPAGSPLSLRDHTFDKILDAADAALNSLIRQLHDKKQHDGELSIKINFADCGAGAIDFDSQIGGKINFVLKATKVCLDENVQIVFDESGNPTLPDDRTHQINFDEIQPGQREYPPSGGTAQVDGKTGIVESYEAVQTDKPEDDSPEKELYPCKNTGCPFYAYDAGNSDASGCAFNEFDPAKGERDPFDVTETVEQNGCTRPEVLQAYADAQPQEDDESEDAQ